MGLHGTPDGRRQTIETQSTLKIHVGVSLLRIPLFVAFYKENQKEHRLKKKADPFGLIQTLFAS